MCVYSLKNINFRDYEIRNYSSNRNTVSERKERGSYNTHVRKYRRKPPILKCIILIIVVIILSPSDKALFNGFIEDIKMNIIVRDNKISQYLSSGFKAENNVNTKDNPKDVVKIEKPCVYYHYDSISKEEKNIYDDILKGINNLDKEIHINNADQDKINKIINMIDQDHAEIFWTEAYSISIFNDKAYLYYDYIYTKSEIKKMQKEINDSIRLIMKKINNTNSDYEKVKLAYEYIIDSVEYELNSKDNQNLYSALVNKKSVCAGYSKGLQYILQKSGIQALYVTGQATEGSHWEAHAWNIVRYQDQYYQIDVTFADPTCINEKGQKIERRKGMYDYSYLFTTDSLMSTTHRLNNKDFDMPKCTDMKNEYFVREGIYSEHFDNKVIKELEKNVKLDKKIFMWQFSNKKALNDFKKNADFVNIIYKNNIFNGNVYYYYNNEMYSVFISY